MADSQLVQFLPLNSVISPNFWHTLTNLKLNHLRLSEDPIPIKATYGVGRVAKDGVGVAAGLTLDEGSFEGPTTLSQSFSSSSLTIPTQGTLLNYNTAPQFTSSDKNSIFNDISNGILQDLLTSQRPTDALARFTVLAFADLKKYKYYHWVAIPALIPSSNWHSASGWEDFREEKASVRDALLEHVQRYRDSTDAGFALVRRDATTEQVTLAPVTDFESFFAGVPEDERTVLFIDPSASQYVPGWPLRNLLALLSLRYGVRRIRVIAWRDELGAQSSTHSIAAVLSMSEDPGSKSVDYNGTRLPLTPLPSDPSRPSATGWERNAQGKLAPKVSDLGPLMDPKRLAEQAVDLNLKLMRWRIMPDIQLEKVSNTKCLLLGAGTLGCHVARILLGWGVRHTTFVDSSRVSYSNPVRQPLFEFEDCTNGGKPKAECAAMRLAKIFPGVHTRGVQMSIPMPGHGVLSTSAEKDVSNLERLIDEHDVVFLLMDSRESRWLPTLLASARNKLVINAALGFDTYLVMRHGAGPEGKASKEESHQRPLQKQDYAQGPQRLGCYFCNDIVAPADSLTDRTLDQMCTVSRPGLAAIAGASAVELMVSILQHADGVSAPAPLPSSLSSTTHPTCLGILPHQIRGHLSTFSSSNITGSSYDKCTACSAIVVEEYQSKGWQGMLKLALSTEGYLEKLTGLDKMYEETEALLLGEDGDVDEWSEEEE